MIFCLILRVALMPYPLICPVAGVLGLLLLGTGIVRKRKALSIWGAGLFLFFLWCFTIEMSDLRGRASGRLTACKSNLKNIGTAIELYQTDQEGRIPSNLGELTPNYLMQIPVCPAYGDDTSVPLWYLSPPDDMNYEYRPGDSSFVVFCSGTKHKAARLDVADYPRLYSDERGLVESPAEGAESPSSESTQATD
jgi:hypothetical protein